MVLKLNKNIGIVFLVLIVLMLVPASGWSQEYGARQQAGQDEVSVNEIASFAKAQNQVVKIQQEYRAKLSGIDDPAQQQPIVQEMNGRLVAAVQQEGLSVERYNEISNAAQSDPALQQRISQLMENMQ
jgi:GTP1/Obg family GTP-binding protein